MTEKTTRRFTREQLDKLIPQISPDDPLFKRGWIVGGFRGGPRVPSKVPPNTKQGSEKERG